MIKRLNKACKFFSCHRGLEDCTFCYCPFYPCLDKNRGEYVYSSKRRKKIWSCEPCSWIHKKKVVDGIFTLIRKSKYRKQSLKNGRTGIIILSHGSKLKKANSALVKSVKAIRRKTGLNLIVPAYLQSCQPSLETRIKEFIVMGCQKIVIVPFFLLNGNHVTRDIPHIIEKERDRHPKVNFIYTKNIGDDMRITDIVSDIIEEAIAYGSYY